jgi:hypothetical protein
MALLCWQWRLVGRLQLWATAGALAIGLRALQAAGWAIALLSTSSSITSSCSACARASAATCARTTVVLPEVGHWVPMVAAERLAKEIRAFDHPLTPS